MFKSDYAFLPYICDEFAHRCLHHTCFWSSLFGTSFTFTSLCDKMGLTWPAHSHTRQPPHVNEMQNSDAKSSQPSAARRFSPLNVISASIAHLSFMPHFYLMCFASPALWTSHISIKHSSWINWWGVEASAQLATTFDFEKFWEALGSKSRWQKMLGFENTQTIWHEYRPYYVNAFSPWSQSYRLLIQQNEVISEHDVCDL